MIPCNNLLVHFSRLVYASANSILYTQLEDLPNGRASEKEVVLDDPIDVQRREKVKEAMIHAWSSYEKYAWGQDELQVLYL